MLGAIDAKMGKLVAAMALAATIFVSTPASANVTYVGHRTIGVHPDFSHFNFLAPATADFTLTTDGTLGSIGASHLLAWQFTLTDQQYTATFDQTNSHADFYFGAQLIATPQDISFDFNDPTHGAILWRTFSGAYSYYCLQCAASRNQEEAIYISDEPFGAVVSLTGLVSLATAQVASGAPEPASWAMLLLGFGVAGTSLRARRRARFFAG